MVQRVAIPDHIRKRVIERQGRWNVHEDVPPEQTAFVVHSLHSTHYRVVFIMFIATGSA